MDKKKSRIKPLVSVGRQDVMVSADSVGRRVPKNRIFKFKKHFYFSIFRKKHF
jgi:hypothetical protein